MAALLLPFPLRGRFWTAVADLLHLPAFAVLTGLVLAHHNCRHGEGGDEQSTNWRRGVLPLWLTLAVIAFSGLIELAQGLLSRHASLDDLFRNAAGAIVALAIYQAIVCRSAVVRTLCVAAAIGLLVLAAWGPLGEIRDSISVGERSGWNGER